MMKKVVLLLAACSVLVSAIPAFAAGTKANDWIGDWEFTYADSVTDTVTFTEVCVAPDCPQGDYWVYVAKGKKSDNSEVQIRKISFAPESAFYYEGTDADIGSKSPRATISDENSDCNSFTVSETKAPITLASGIKLNVPEECPVDNCTLQYIIPAKIGKVMAFAQPIMPFVIIGDATASFPIGTKATFDSDAIVSLIQVRLTKRIIIAICLVRPMKLSTLESGSTIGVTAFGCTGEITVR